LSDKDKIETRIDFKSESFKKYFKNTSWLFSEKILRMVVGLFVGVWVARYLGPDRFGLLSYAMAFVGLFVSLSTLGLDGIVIRELVKDESKRDKLIGTVFWLKLVGGFVVLLVLAVAVNFTSNDAYTNLLVFIIASATVFQSFNVIDFYFQAKVLSKYVVFANIIGLAISSIVKIVLIIIEAPLIAFAWTILFDSLVLAIGLVYFYLQNHLSFKDWNIEKSTAINLLKDSWPLILSGMVVAFYMRIDQVMIKEMMGASAVGQYAAAVRLSEAWYFIPMVVTSSLFPAIINAKKQSEELYYTRLQKLYDFMVWMAVAIALPMTFLSDWVVKLLFGGEYIEAGSVLMIHVWTGLFVSLGVARGKWLLIENLQKYSIIYLGVGLISNVIANYYFIKIYGINGAAYATLLANGLGTIVTPFFIRKTRISFFMMIRSIFFISFIKLLLNGKKSE
jgi:O-antigen/teichoic acid export membrane protein